MGKKSLRQVPIMITILALTIISSVATAEFDQIVLEYNFDRPSIKRMQIGKEVFDRVILPEAPNGGEIGQPALPGQAARILLPRGRIAENVQVIMGEKIFLGSGYEIEPVCRPFILSEGPTELSLPIPDARIYSSLSPFPELKCENIGTQSFRGYKIQVLKLRPVEFIPAKGELYYYPRIKVIISTRESGKSDQLFRGFARDDREVRHKIDNFDILSTYPSTDFEKQSNYDLLIITHPELFRFFSPLKDYHDSTGIITEIHTTSEIGGSSPETVRNYIRDQYLNNGIEYVLIGGDDNLIPAPNLYVVSWIGGSVETNMPGDVYFACLDESYNADKDSFWGESVDGPGGSDIDLMAEVYVGRAPVGDSLETIRFVEKTLTYLCTQGDWLENIILAGEYLGFGGLGDYGGYSLEELEGGSSEHGYTTVGIPPEIFQIEKFYDMNSFWLPDQIATEINSGLHFINHYGHSSTGRSLKMTTAVLDSYLTNENPIFIYSQGCLAGHFDDMDCWAEYVTVKNDYGAFAVVMNARYGYGALYSTDGASQRYNREFWDAVFNPLEGLTELGKISQDAKEDNLYRINEGCMRWCYYGLNLLGDPTVPIKSVRTIAFDYDPELPAILPLDENLSVNVTITGVGQGLPVPGSGQFHYAIDSRDFETVAMQESEPNHYQVQFPLLSCGARIYFYFSAEESELGRIYDVDPAQVHLAIAGSDTVTIFFDDFETDRGWTISGGLWERGYPAGSGGNTVSGPDPKSPYSGIYEYGYNLYGNYEHNLDSMHLISPAINCFNRTGVCLSFWRCLGVEAPVFDHASICVSTDAESWTVVWENTAEAFDVSWVKKEYDISAYADHQPTVYLRWTMGPSDSALAYCGWNIDDVLVTARFCQISSCGDANNDSEINVSDAVYIINYVFINGQAPAPPESGDVNCDGSCNVSDAVYIINYVFTGGNFPCDTNGDDIPDC